MRRFLWTVCVPLLLAATASPAFAHPGHGVSKNVLAEGLLHPLLGFDHLLAMVTVGLLSAQLGGRALWSVPCSFLLCMVAGGALGLTGWSLPGIEIGIAASVMLLGAAVAWNDRRPLLLAMLFCGAFGFIHGHAHGTELPSVSQPALYILGFVTATAALHMFGVVAGWLALKSPTGAVGLRISGATIAATGLWFVASL